MKAARRQSLRQFYNRVLDEPLPDPFLKMLADLDAAGDAARPASELRHAPGVSLNRPGHTAQSHNLSDAVSTHTKRDGSNA